MPWLRINLFKSYSWNEWVTLPMQFSDLPRTAMLALTILDCAGAGKTAVVGGTTISFFGKDGLYRQVTIFVMCLLNVLYM